MPPPTSATVITPLPAAGAVEAINKAVARAPRACKRAAAVVSTATRRAARAVQYTPP